MSVSSILEQIQKKGRLPTTPQQQHQPQNDQRTRTSHSNSGHSSSARPKLVDPIVARLKEKRRLERQEAERKAREKKGLAPKPPPKPREPKSKPSLASNPAPRPGNVKNIIVPKPPTQTPSASKKMNFKDLMKKASSIDNTKLSISIKNKPKADPNLRSPSPRHLSTKNQGLNRSHDPTKPISNTHFEKPVPPPSTLRDQPRAPLPIRQPSVQLKDRLGVGKKESRPSRPIRYEEPSEDDEDLSSFIVSSEEEELAGRGAAPDYDRDEIWAMFNRGKKRSHYVGQGDEYDTDDMEATGAEILREEQLSRRRGELEDKKELEEEMRLAQLKKARRRR